MYKIELGKSWKDFGIKRQSVLNNFKLALFDKNYENMHIYIGEFIMNGEAQYLYENLVEIWIELYLSYNSDMLNYLDSAINILENSTKHDIILSQHQRNIFHNITNILYYSQSYQKPKKYTYYVKQQKTAQSKVQTPNEPYKRLFKAIMKTYQIDKDNDKQEYNDFKVLFYYISHYDTKNVFIVLNNIINKYSRKERLNIAIPTTNKNVSTHYITLLHEIAKIIIKQIGDPQLDIIYTQITRIYNYKLKLQNIYFRSNFIFLLYEILLDRLYITTQISNTPQLDIHTIGNIYLRLFDFYEVNTITSQVDIPKKKSKENVVEPQEDSEKEPDELPENIKCLFTLPKYSKKRAEKCQLKADLYKTRYLNTCNKLQKEINVSADPTRDFVFKKDIIVIKK